MNSWATPIAPRSSGPRAWPGGEDVADLPQQHAKAGRLSRGENVIGRDADSHIRIASTKASRR